MTGGEYAVYFNEKRFSDGIFNNIYNLINKKISLQVFTCGVERVKALQNASMTFYANRNFPKLSLQTLQKRTRDEMLAFGGAATPTKHIFIEDENNLVNDVCELTPTALTGDSWLNLVCKQVDALIDGAKKKYADRFSLSDVLSPLMRPPYGFFPNQPNYAILGYALRKHKDDLFNPTTSQPVGDEKLNEMIETLLKMWDNGTSESSSKLALRFGSVEERTLTSILGEIFNLGAVKGVNLADLKSLTYAKWCITEFCKQIAKYPLWSLLYCNAINETSRGAIEELINIFNQDSYTLDKIKSLYKKVKENQVDLYKLLVNTSNYGEGFVTFINKMKEVEIKPEWWEELEVELSYMQSEIAFRREEDVRSCVLEFYIRKIKAAQQVVKIDIEDDNENSDLNNKKDVQISEEGIKEAKSLIKTMTMPNHMWQKIMIDLLDEHPEASEFIISCLK